MSHLSATPDLPVPTYPTYALLPVTIPEIVTGRWVGGTANARFSVKNTNRKYKENYKHGLTRYYIYIHNINYQYYTLGISLTFTGRFSLGREPTTYPPTRSVAYNRMHTKYRPESEI